MSTFSLQVHLLGGCIYSRTESKIACAVLIDELLDTTEHVC